MRDPEDFDAFYASTRERLLLQTYAMTGDLTAAQAAVEDAYVAAWQHWRKVSRSPDPEAWIRPLAWRLAHRRETARMWHREKTDDPELIATLEALGSLSGNQRRMLVLNHLAQGSMADFAREVGIAPEVAARELQSASARYATTRTVPSPMIVRSFAPLRAPVAAKRWPRATIVRRAGATRRRTHTLLGAAAAVAALVIGGLVVTGQDHPVLAEAGVAEVSASATASESAEPPETEAAPEPELTGRHLLAADQLGRLAPRRTWRETGTSANTEGDGQVVPCQQARYADPDGLGALVRRFESRGKRKDPAVSAVQLTELSATPRAAKRTYGTLRDWFAGCAETHTQLLGASTVAGVGDEAMSLTLRRWRGAGSVLTVGIARTGRLTTATATTVAGDRPLAPESDATLLAAAVNGLCGSPGAATCAAPPRVQDATVPAAGAVPAMLSEIDLPPVTGIRSPWVGTEPRRASTNVAATQCDQADFSARPVSNALTRTFVVPQGKVPVTFGLTETVGTLPAKQAVGFVDTVQRRLTQCEDDNLGTTVVPLVSRSSPSGELHAWRLDVEVTDERSVSVYMGVTRSGTALAQVGFTPAPRATMTRAEFLDVLARAQTRLAELPAPDPVKKPRGKKRR